MGSSRHGLKKKSKIPPTRREGFLIGDNTPRRYGIMAPMNITAIPVPLIASSSLPWLGAVGVALSHPTLDLAFIFGLAAAALFTAFAVGRRKVVSAIMISYMAIAIFAALPADRILAAAGLQSLWFARAALFLIIFFLMVLLLGARRVRGFAAGGAWWQTLFLALVLAGLLAHITLSLLPQNKIPGFGPLVKRVFTDPSLRVWWLVAPAGLLILIRRLAMRDE